MIHKRISSLDPIYQSIKYNSALNCFELIETALGIITFLSILFPWMYALGVGEKGNLRTFESGDNFGPLSSVEREFRI